MLAYATTALALGGGRALLLAIAWTYGLPSTRTGTSDRDLNPGGSEDRCVATSVSHTLSNVPLQMPSDMVNLGVNGTGSSRMTKGSRILAVTFGLLGVGAAAGALAGAAVAALIVALLEGPRAAFNTGVLQVGAA